MNQCEEILIVDDKPANLKLLSQVLAGQGYRVRAASSGRHALESVRISPPNLILLDIKMPDMNGYEVCETLKHDDLTRDTPVIFISALDDVREKVRGFRAGGVDYITKPFQVDEVIARVETHLGLRRLQKQLQDNNQRMASELHLAALTQANFMPRELPQPDGWKISATLIPALETSGDFYDVFDLPGGLLGILVADVVDKGVAAALFMVLAWSLVRESAGQHPENPAKIFEIVNQKILAIMDRLVYVTIFLGILDVKTGQLTYANAGHPPPLLCRSKDMLEYLARTGIPLGISEEHSWNQAKAQINQGDTLVLYTDGIIEACDPTDAFYGLDCLKASIQQHMPQGVDEIQKAILADLNKFLGGKSPQDDVALVVVKSEEKSP
jgi:sigma-B regulation protein RsbU (phosphoserine phosphatase)